MKSKNLSNMIFVTINLNLYQRNQKNPTYFFYENILLWLLDDSKMA